MSVARIIEISASSSDSMEDAVRSGPKKCAESVKNIQGARVDETKVVTDPDGNVIECRVDMRVGFVVR